MLLIAGIAMLQLLCVPGHYLGWAHDDVLYVLAARSLLTGAYTLGISPGLPPLTEITPGWPLLLAPAALASGDYPAGYQLWSWLWLVLCSALFWMWLRRRLSAPGAAAGAALFALNPLVLSRSGVVMSEMPFLAVLMALLLLLESRRGLRGWQSGCGLGFAWLIRPGALALFPAVWGWYLYRRRYRDAALSAAAALGTILLWQLWAALAGQNMAEVGELAMTLPGQGAFGLVGTAIWNASHALTLWGRTMLPWAAPSASTAALCVGVVLALLCAAGARVLYVERRYETAMVYLACGVAMHLLWPWWYERYLVTLLPFLIWGLALALERFSHGRTAAIFAVLTILPLPVQLPRLMRGDRARQRPELIRTYEWIRGNTPASALITSPFYGRDSFYTGRPFVPLPVSLAEPSRRESLPGGLGNRGIDYVLWQGLPDLGSSLGERYYWSRRLRRFETLLGEAGLPAVFSNTSEGAVLYRVPRAERGQKSH
ncbi:MAG: hypothetical protein ABIJ96_11600 [Elusimicrobiota bacterium]